MDRTKPSLSLPRPTPQDVHVLILRTWQRDFVSVTKLMIDLLGALILSDKITPFYPTLLFFQVQDVKNSKGFCHHEEKRRYSLLRISELYLHVQ